MAIRTYRHHSAEPMPTDAPFASVYALPVLVKADDIRCLKGLDLPPEMQDTPVLSRSVIGRLHVAAKVVIGKDHLFHAVEP